MTRPRSLLLLAAAAVALAQGALAATPVTVQDPNGTQATVGSQGLNVVVANQYSGAPGATGAPGVGYVQLFDSSGDPLGVAGNPLSAISASSAAAGAFLDGWDATRGTKSDIATGYGVAGSEMSYLRGIRDSLSLSLIPGNNTTSTGCVVIKAGPGNLYGLIVSTGAAIAGTVDRVMLFNATTAPANGTPPNFVPMTIATNQSNNMPLPGNVPLVFTVGIVACVSSSTTLDSLTAEINPVNFSYVYQ